MMDGGWKLNGLILWRFEFYMPMSDLGGVAWIAYRGKTVKLRDDR